MTWFCFFVDFGFLGFEIILDAAELFIKPFLGQQSLFFLPFLEGLTFQAGNLLLKFFDFSLLLFCVFHDKFVVRLLSRYGG